MSWVPRDKAGGGSVFSPWYIPCLWTSLFPFCAHFSCAIPSNAISSLASEEEMVTSRLKTSLAILAAQICWVSTKNWLSNEWQPRGWWWPHNYSCFCPGTQSHPSISFILSTLRHHEREKQPLLIAQMLISFVNLLISFVVMSVADKK